MKKVIKTVLILIVMMCIFQIKSLATDITSKTEILLNETNINNKVIDDNENTYITISNNSKIKIKSEENIDGIYIIYEYTSKMGTLSSNRDNYKYW